MSGGVGPGARVTVTWYLLALYAAAQGSIGPQPEPPPLPIEIRGRHALSGDRFLASDGIPVAIAGIQAPEPGDDGEGSSGDRGDAGEDELQQHKPGELALDDHYYTTPPPHATPPSSSGTSSTSGSGGSSTSTGGGSGLLQAAAGAAGPDAGGW